MKKRIITALIGLPILAVVLFFYQTYVLNAALSLVCGIAVYELLNSTKFVTQKGLLIISILFGMYIPFAIVPVLEPYFLLIVMAYLTLMLIILFAKHRTIPFQQVAVSFAGALLVPYGLSSIIYLRDLAEPKMELYYILLILSCAWISDIGAYFIGLTFGRHKLCPNISPKKTVEGAFGGLFFCVVVNIAITYVYCDIIGKSGVETEVHLLNLILISLAASLVGIAGDLTCSIIKRQTGIKDFGTIMPGHGGVLDRFDSILLIAPFLYVILQIFAVVTVL